MKYRHTKTLGFTLPELMTVVTIVTVSSMLAVSGFNRLLQRTRIDALSHQLINHLMVARSHAILKNQFVVMCKSANGFTCDALPDWNSGWIIFTDPEKSKDCQSADGYHCRTAGKILYRQPPLKNQRIKLLSNRDNQVLRFNPMGWSEGNNRSFFVCDNAFPEQSKQVLIARTGRARVAQLAQKEQCVEIKLSKT